MLDDYMGLGEVISTDLRKKLRHESQYRLVDAIGSYFIMNRYNFIVDLSAADIVEGVFATDEYHQTWHHTIDQSKSQKARSQNRKLAGRRLPLKTFLSLHVREDNPENPEEPPDPPPEDVRMLAGCGQAGGNVAAAMRLVRVARGGAEAGVAAAVGVAGQGGGAGPVVAVGAGRGEGGDPADPAVGCVVGAEGGQLEEDVDELEWNQMKQNIGDDYGEDYHDELLRKWMRFHEKVSKNGGITKIQFDQVEDQELIEKWQKLKEKVKKCKGRSSLRQVDSELSGDEVFPSGLTEDESSGEEDLAIC